MLLSIISIIVAIIALCISSINFYQSRLKTGTVKMTKPTTIFFGPDGVHMENISEQKIFIRTLLYSTSDKGQYIQNMFIRLHRGELIQNFNVWVYGDTELVRGSGLFVSKQGISNNHHFLLPRNISFEFIPGDYRIEVFVEAVHKVPYKIFEQILQVTALQYEEVKTRKAGIFYDWAPNSQNYDASVSGRSKKDLVLPDIA